MLRAVPLWKMSCIVVLEEIRSLFLIRHSHSEVVPALLTAPSSVPSVRVLGS